MRELVKVQHPASSVQRVTAPQPTVDARRSTLDLHSDQAATLRRLFAQPRMRVLPVLMPEQQCAVRTSWVAKLAQAFAQAGERTLVVDAARAQVAASLGLRARFDLAHVLNGECAPAAALLDAGPQLTIVPAARALAMAQSVSAPLTALLPVLHPALQARGGVDAVLLLLPATADGAVARLPAGDVLLPLLPEAAAITQSLREAERIAARRVALDSGQPSIDSGPCVATPGFRLLFLGMEKGPAATLARGLSIRQPARQSACGAAMPLVWAGAVRSARDLATVTRAAGGWTWASTLWTA